MNIVRTVLEDPAALLAGLGAGALLRLETSATGGGAGFSELTTTVIVSTQTLYTCYDLAGTNGTWYRSRTTTAAGTSPSPYSAEYQATASGTLYCGLPDVKQRLGILATDTADDEELLQHADQAAGFIESKTGRPLYPDPVTAYTFDGMSAVDSGRTLLVPRGVRTVSAITHATVTGATPTTVTAADYILRPLVQDRPPGWPATEIRLTDVAALPYWYPAYSNIIVTGTFGWSAVPREIEAIALRLVINSWKLRGSGGADIVSVGVDGSRTFENALSWQDRKTLESYAGAAYVG